MARPRNPRPLRLTDMDLGTLPGDSDAPGLSDEPMRPTLGFDPEPMTLSEPIETAPKVKPERKKATRAVAVSSTAKTLSGVHYAVASLTNTPDFELTADESDALATALYDVMVAWNVEMALDPRWTSTVEFVSVVVAVERPKVIALMAKPPKRREAPADDAPVPAMVLPL